MKKVTIFKLSLWIGFSTSLIGFFLKTAHYPMSSIYLGFSTIFALIIIVLGLKEIHLNEKISFTERAMWSIAFIFFTLIAGIAYFPTYRKRNE